jgi:hypothetical protein
MSASTSAETVIVSLAVYPHSILTYHLQCMRTLHHDICCKLQGKGGLHSAYMISLGRNQASSFHPTFCSPSAAITLALASLAASASAAMALCSCTGRRTSLLHSRPSPSPSTSISLLTSPPSPPSHPRGQSLHPALTAWSELWPPCQTGFQPGSWCLSMNNQTVVHLVVHCNSARA